MTRLAAVAVECALVACALAACAIAPWPKSAGETTCAEWLSDMTADQRSGLAMGILLAVTNGGVEHAVQAVGNADSAELARRIGGSCQALGGDRRISDIGAMNLMVPMGIPTSS